MARVSANETHPSWTVTLVCGASGVGKTCLARPLAARYGVPLSEADDVVIGLRAMTTPAHLPLVHFWDTHPEAAEWPPERIAECHLAVMESLRPAFMAIIADHIEFQTPVVLEGDYFLPGLASEFAPAVRAVVIDEPDVGQLEANFRARPPNAETAAKRALVSAIIGAELRERGARAGAAIVAARPWSDGIDRVDRALRNLPG